MIHGVRKQSRHGISNAIALHESTYAVVSLGVSK